MGNILDPSEIILELGLSGSVTEQERAIVSTAIQRAEASVKRYLKYDPVQASRTEYYPMQNLDPAARRAVWEVQDGFAYPRQLTTAATAELQVRHLPIRSSPAIDLRIDYGARSGTVSGSFADETLKAEGVDFWPNYDAVASDGNPICMDGVFRSVGSWPTEPGSVRVIYTAGYTPEELHGQDDVIDASPIAAAVLDEAVRRTRKAFISMKQATGWAAGTITGERLGDYSYTVDAATAQKMFGGMTDLLPETMSMLEDFVNYGWMLAS